MMHHHALKSSGHSIYGVIFFMIIFCDVLLWENENAELFNTKIRFI